MKNSNTLMDNMKKALMEMILLKFLSKREMHINAVIDLISAYSEDRINVVFPYGAIYRLLDCGYIIESRKMIVDGRRRQLYEITDKGREHLKKLEEDYGMFTTGLNSIYHNLNEKDYE